MSCASKAAEVYRRLFILVTHDEISDMCREMGSSTPQEFYDLIRRMNDKELEDLVMRAKKKQKQRQPAPYIM
jgi:hypothetical protein